MPVASVKVCKDAAVRLREPKAISKVAVVLVLAQAKAIFKDVAVAPAWAP